MKRSNRLVLLIGIFLAVIAFIGIIFVSSNPNSQTPGTTPPPNLPTVFAKADIPLGTVIDQNNVNNLFEVRQVATPSRDATAFQDPALLIGSTIRSNVRAGKEITASDFGGQSGQIQHIDVPQGFRAMAIQVDQLSGVGTVIQPGDWVDVVLAITGDKFPVVTVNKTDNSITTVAGINSTSVKLIIQGVQVLGTLLPPPPATNPNATPTPAPSGPSSGQNTALNGQQQIVIVAVSAQQAEIIKYAQLDGSVSLALRSPKDFVDASGSPVIPVPDKTTGITLKVLTGPYQVLVPELVETILPTQPGG